MISVTTNELVDAIRAATRTTKDADGFATTKEIARASGLSPLVVRQRLHAIHEAGNLETRQVQRIGIDGTANHAPAYRVRGKRK